MTIEEKAKAYDEALEKVRPLYERAKKDDSPILATYEHLFPQLAESEDERIRKSIIRLLQVGGYMSPEDKKEAYAWLEKQKEQKPKRERKKPKESWLSKLKYELAHEEELLIERGKELSEIGALKNKDQKEQKSSIVEKLREISTPADEDWFEIEKKWESEDNEDLRSFISVKFASNAKVIDGKRFAVFTWERFKDIALELVNRGKEKQKEQKPDNPFTPLEGLGVIKAKYYDEGFKNGFDEGVDSAKPAEWSEEDSDMICEIIDHCIAIPYIGGTLHLSDERKKELKTFLKSLRPQPHWKPSEEQIRVFLKANPINLMPEELSIYKSLCNDIQKLM